MDKTTLIILIAVFSVLAVSMLVLIIVLLARLERLMSESRRTRVTDADRFASFSRDSQQLQLTQQKELAESLRRLSEDNYSESRRNAELLSRELEKIRSVVDEKLNETLSKRLDSSFRTVSEQLENVYRSLGEMKELSVSVTDNVSGLSRILSNVKARGTWGETQLKNILDDIVPTLYETNVATNPESQKRVEFAVRMFAGGNSTVLLPIDSKFPIEDYARLTRATDEGNTAEMQEARKQLRTRLLAEARAVSEYIHEPETAPFAVLYLATEGLYAELSSDEALVARIRSECRVLLCGPTTVAALLNSLALGMRTARINRKAEEIRLLLVAVRDEYGKFTTLLGKVRRKLGEAESVLDEAERRNRAINRKLTHAELGDGQDDAEDTAGGSLEGAAPGAGTLLFGGSDAGLFEDNEDNEEIERVGTSTGSGGQGG